MTHLRNERTVERDGKVIVTGQNEQGHRVVEVYSQGELLSRKVEGGPPQEDGHSRSVRMKLSR